MYTLATLAYLPGMGGYLAAEFQGKPPQPGKKVQPKVGYSSIDGQLYAPCLQRRPAWPSRPRGPRPSSGPPRPLTPAALSGCQVFLLLAATYASTSLSRRATASSRRTALFLFRVHSMLRLPCGSGVCPTFGQQAANMDVPGKARLEDTDFHALVTVAGSHGRRQVLGRKSIRIRVKGIES